MHSVRGILRRSALIAVVLVFSTWSRTAAQVGSLISPGPLSKAHARLEGIENCEKCHEERRKVSAVRCLVCHEPVARRIAAGKGVHRGVKDDCVSCHVEHAGRDADLRHFDPKLFDHNRETSFALVGKHAAVAQDCARCHRTRSFLTVRSECVACHADVHRGALGTDCQRCHAVTAGFKEAQRQFDHSKTQFPLEGAHRSVACARCHPAGQFKGVRFAACTDCHKNPHPASFGTVCRTCHDMNGWRVERFDHAKTGTPLTGAHASVPCAKCHVRPATQVKLKMVRCAACHRDPHGGEFKQDCSACHRDTAFRDVSFDHAARTHFPLEGKHAALQCSTCHKSAVKGVRDYRGLKTQCAACHADPHRGQLGTACEQCHQTTSFKVSAFTHTRFPEFFAGQHQQVACDRCHVRTAPGGQSARVYKELSTECVTCHRDVHLGQFPRCTDCHTIAAPKFAAALFRHDATNFPLTGKHANVACDKCHKSESAAFPSGSGAAVRYHGTAAACSACHRDVHMGQLGSRCESCHTTAAFRLTSYTHTTRPGFFKGRHAAAACGDCHKETERDFPAGHGRAILFKPLGAACSDCHKDPHNGQLGTNCSSCHTAVTQWSTVSRAFHKASLFPLEGRHLATPCESCHLNGVTKGTPTACFDCHWIRHQDDRYRTQLGNQCDLCHRPVAWGAVNWNHAARTGFALSTPHNELACDQCHRNATFAGTPAECSSCHLGDYQKTNEPDHAAAGFPTNCQLCHKPSDPSWTFGRFDHSTFNLAGRHAQQPCAACHRNNVYAGTPRECSGCHLAAYNATSSPSHAAAGFSTACESCHRFTDSNWSDATYVHQSLVLTGAHATAQCSGCHRNNVYAGTSRTCVTCHQSDYDRAASPNHVAAGFPTTCENCHRFADSSWQQGAFSHDTFALLGVHATQACSACHSNGVYAGTPRVCSGCHISAWNASKSPNHAAAGFSTTCDSCHRYTDTSWAMATYSHLTYVPLGVHVNQSCAACHGTGVYAGTSTVCSTCHLPAFNSATNPNHVSAGFPATCELCHRPADPAWSNGIFAHTTFPLAGVHATQACLTCHVNNVFAGTPRVCSGCHLPQYNATTTPNHVAAGFPTTCDSCHQYTDPSWSNGIFAHTTFPLAGVHATEPCAACHINVYAGTPRDCAGCHLALYNATTSPNHVASGFPTTCASCHKFTDTSWNQGVFAHTTFPLAGVHATQPCSACHVNNVYAGTPRTCVGCHLAQYNATTDPNHIAAGFPTTCDTCHRFTDTSWNQGRFNHTWFPITSGAHAGNPCSACHTNPSNYAVFTCTTCHTRSSTDEHHQGVAGYVYDSHACYSCHPTGRTN